MLCFNSVTRTCTNFILQKNTPTIKTGKIILKTFLRLRRDSGDVSTVCGICTIAMVTISFGLGLVQEDETSGYVQPLCSWLKFRLVVECGFVEPGSFSEISLVHGWSDGISICSVVCMCM